jgi:hypothetical protein
MATPTPLVSKVHGKKTRWSAEFVGIHLVWPAPQQP